MISSTDRIEKKVLLRAPQERVWRALSDAKQFGSWFGCRFDGDFVAGKPIEARIVPTTVDPEVAKLQEPHVGLRMILEIDRIEPMHLFSYRWHPFAIDPNVDYSNEPTTLVTFALEPAEGGTLLTIVETGFDSLPAERRTDAYEANDEGWTAQLRLVEKYVTQ